MIDQVNELLNEAEQECRPVFERMEARENRHTRAVLDAFSKENVGTRHFAPTTGYGYDDVGRDTLERIVADLFHAEAAIVRPHLVSGTAALYAGLSGLVLPGDELLSATGLPYDTMQTVLGLSGNAPGNLREMGILYRQADLRADGTVDEQAVVDAIGEKTKLVMFQRSRGYAWRPGLMTADMKHIFASIRAKKKDIIIFVDNCYGAFVEDEEPIAMGADVVVGSMIKNLGGGLAPTGGYAAGREDLIERIAMRMTAPGIGREEGSYAGDYRPFYQGLFMAPHTVCQALKTAALAANVFKRLGMRVSPAFDAQRTDIIQAIELKTPERLLAFCRAVQASSPVDASAVPEAWDMPGYEDQVVMAAGTFVSGASVELSADAPMREPYIVYMQGALTYAHGRLALENVLRTLLREGLV